MKYLVGSRALNINSLTSDYDIHECHRSSKNIHTISFKETAARDKVDVHYFAFEDKKTLLKALNESSVQALLYKEFRGYWGITDEEAIEIIEQYKEALRSYELSYYKQQLLHEPISFAQIKEEYDKYKLARVLKLN